MYYYQLLHFITMHNIYYYILLWDTKCQCICYVLHWYSSFFDYIPPNSKHGCTWVLLALTSNLWLPRGAILQMWMSSALSKWLMGCVPSGSLSQIWDMVWFQLGSESKLGFDSPMAKLEIWQMMKNVGSKNVFLISQTFIC